MSKLDRIDSRLLELLQGNAQNSSQSLSEVLNLSPSQIGRRRQRLEQEGFITGTTCKVNAEKLGLSVQAFIQIQTGVHTAETHSSISRLIQRQPEITAAWTMTGDADYLLRVYCADLAALNNLIQNVLLPHPSIAGFRARSSWISSRSTRPCPLSVKTGVIASRSLRVLRDQFFVERANVLGHGAGTLMRADDLAINRRYRGLGAESAGQKGLICAIDLVERIVLLENRNVVGRGRGRLPSGG